MYMCKCFCVSYMLYMKKSGGPEQKGILQTAVSSLLALISTVQHNLLWDPCGFYIPKVFLSRYAPPPPLEDISTLEVSGARTLYDIARATLTHQNSL